MNACERGRRHGERRRPRGRPAARPAGNPAGAGADPAAAILAPQTARKLAHELITASVSTEGYAKVVSVMAMAHVRRALVLMSARPR